MQSEEEIYNDILWPLTQIVGLPSAFSDLLLNPDFSHHSIAKRDSGEARTFSSSCFDAFTVFAFLAFMLALLDLILELQGDAGRKKRDISDQEMLDRNATLASHFMMRGFLNTWDISSKSKSQNCQQKVFCEGIYEASKLGSIGQEIAKISSVKAAEFLHGIDSEFFRAIEESGMLDEQQNPEDVTADCQEVFPQHHQCQNITNSDSYRFPGRKNWKKFIPLLNKFS